MRTSALLLSWTFVALLAGCGGSGSGAISVSGEVTVDGAPWIKGAVRFVPDKSKGNLAPHEASGTIETDGRYSLYTLGKPGAMAGWYKVSVSSGAIPDSGNPNSARPAFPVRFGDPEKSGFLVEVVASPPPGAYDLKIASR